jgi:hypothetical protein
MMSTGGKLTALVYYPIIKVNIAEELINHSTNIGYLYIL